MLVLTRKKGERIVIGDGVVMVEVVEVRGDSVRLGITAPRDVEIHREEVAETIARQGRRAAAPVVHGGPSDAASAPLVAE